MGDASILDVAALSEAPEPAITRARTAVIAARYDAVPGLAAHVAVVEGWDSPPAWFDVPALDLQPEILRIVVTALGRGIGDAFAAHATPGLDRIARSALGEAQAELAARIASKSTLYARSGAECMSAVATEGAAVVAWVGSARAYHAGREITVLTREHTLVEDYRRFKPDITEEELEQVPQGVLTRVLGAEPAPTIDTVAIALAAGDRLVLVSSGVHEAFDAGELLAALSPDLSARDAVRALMRAASESTGEDGRPVAVAVLRRPR